MNRLSVLIFTKDKVKDTLRLIKNVYVVASEIVVMDSSTVKNRNAFEKELKKGKLSKVRTFYVAPLGYPDPMREFALRKCRNEWVLLMDTDETLSEELAGRIPSVIKDAKADGFMIDRVEKDGAGKVMGRAYQLRLYRKSKVKYNGMPHEFPEVHGKTDTIDAPFSIIHVHDFGALGKNLYASEVTSYRTIVIESFTNRLAYGDLMSKVSKGNTFAGSLFGMYMRAKGAKPEEELSWLDYWLFFKFPVFDHVRSSFPALNMKSVKDRLDYARYKLGYFFKVDKVHRKLQFAISMDLEKDKGIINYLGLGSPEVIQKINKVFIDRDANSLAVLGYLLYKRHELGKGYYRHLSDFGSYDAGWMKV